ncbi:hypothetical protein K435DRAFT_864282 [Dendrothele bispora CBS 962.96]|uniref:Proteasome activator Blm10 middle HEAT repeats region domain-containing protein n=1 Tax=Dendrothele bispora (strain CBS 962.96) TaxID=1314807 RepID=A0A4S8LML4_DENBC|nr:hypothetical protein K435DRAFT_864282 [Dendrothele bispora CBS 962.96]
MNYVSYLVLSPASSALWAAMLSRLLAKKSKRKLEITDLQLPWRPLWGALKKELWVKKRVRDSSRNVVNVLLYIAAQCKRYYSEDEIPSTLDEFLPLMTQDVRLSLQIVSMLLIEHPLNASTTAGHADSMADRQSLKIKKSINRQQALSKIMVYSISADDPIREIVNDKSPIALDTLERLITSTESFFHPSNSGQWTSAVNNFIVMTNARVLSVKLTSFLQHLTGEFIERWHEEQQETCKTPVTQWLTRALRRAFVNISRTPALLGMFSKHPISLGLAQGSLRAMTLLGPNIIMPEFLECAYGGLEVVNETHRTTAVLSTLTGIDRPLSTEKVWLAGRKHVVPLLELRIPGIDINDPNKTIFATMFIVAFLQNIKVGDLSSCF